MGKFIPENLPNPLDFFDSVGVQLTGSGRWRNGPCHFHDGNDSLRINTQSGGWICLNCNVSGMDILSYRMLIAQEHFVKAARALEAWQGDDHDPPKHLIEPRPISASDAIQILAIEARIVAWATLNLDRIDLISGAERTRLKLASKRVIQISKAFNEYHS